MDVSAEFIQYILKKQDIDFKHYPDKGFFQICNPFTDDRKFHMGLNYRLQVYNCFKTSEKGGLFFFFRKLLNVSEERLIHMLMKFNKHKPIVIKEQEEVVDDGVVHYHNVPNNWVLVDDIPAQPAKSMHYAYLLRRNISKDKILRNKFYYSTQDTSRVVIPYTMNGNLVYWIARDILGKADKKYLYPPENLVKNKRSDLLYNYDFANRDELIICEGQFNALIVDGVAIGGKDISDMQLKLIRFMAPKKVILAFDQDVPGKKAIAKNLPLLAPYFNDNLYFLSADVTEEDFADMGEEGARRYITSNVSRYTPASAYAEKFFH
jgi:DNA primase